MPFHLSDFLSGDFDLDLQLALQQIAPFPEHLVHCLLCGPPRSGKTSILMHFAYKAGLRGQQVVVICHREKMESSFPTLPQGVDKSSPAWEHVHLRYLSTGADIQKYAACLHLANTPPHAVIIDDLSSFLQSRSADKRTYEMELIKSLALLHEATLHVSRKHAQSCNLLVSDAGGPEGPWSLYIYERWCPLILTIQAADNNLSLSALPAMAERHALHSSCLSQLQFSLTKHSALTLEGVYAPMP